MQEARVSRGIILAAGVGDRLGSLTTTCPKGLLPVSNQEPLITYPIRALVDAGIREIAVVVGYLAGKVVQDLGDGSRLGVKLQYVVNSDYLGGNASSVLAAKEWAAGKTVIGAGRKATAPRTLVISCDKYYYLDQNRRIGVSDQPTEEQSNDILLIRAVQATMDDQGTVVGSKLHQAMQRLDPSFDFRALGYTTFAKYLKASSAVKVKRPRGPGDVTAELADSTLSTLGQPLEANVWDQELDRRWSEKLAKGGHSLPGPVAAMEAAKVIGVNKLKDSQYKTLQGLLESSEYLNSRWSREGNLIMKRMSA